MTVRVVVRLLWPLFLAIGCSLEPNPSPYPIPGSGDIWQPGRSDTTSAFVDVAAAADASAPEEDAVATPDISGEDSLEDSLEGDVVVATDAEGLDAVDDAETSADVDIGGVEDAEDDVSVMKSRDVQTLMEED